MAKREAWCVDATALTDIAVFSLEKPISSSWADGIPPATFGVVRMLEELAMQFDIIDAQADFAPYKLLILPDVLEVDAALAAKIESYVANGGHLLVSYHSGVRDGRMQLPCVGVEYAGEIAMSPDFVVPSDSIGVDLPRTGHAMYLRGAQVEPLPGTQVLATTVKPYFERSWRHFCSHRHTPSDGSPGSAAVTQRGNVIYFAHPVFGQYQDSAPRWVKHLVRDAINRLVPQPLLRHHGPSTITTSVMQQATRTVVHLLHYIPERRGQQFDVIEDVIPLFDIKISVRIDRPITHATIEPAGLSVATTVVDGRLTLTVPEIRGHCMVVLHHG